MKLLTIAFGLALISISCLAQENYVPGYIVKKNADTLRGYLQEERKQDLLKQVKFKENSNSAISAFGTDAVVSFAYDQGNIYKSVSFQSADDTSVTKTYFANQLVEGGYNLYEFEENGETDYLVQQGSNTYLLYNTTYHGTGEINRPGNYLNQLNLLCVACDQLRPRLTQLGYYHKELIAFVSDLNKCVNPGKQVKNYYHKPKIHAEVIIFAGGLPISSVRSQITGEILARFSYPQISNRTFLNVGLHYSNTINSSTLLSYGNIKYHDKEHHQVICVPATIQYNLVSWVVQPYVCVGFSLAYLSEITDETYFTPRVVDNRFGVSVIGAAGLEVNISKILLAKAEWRYELLLQYPAIGLALKF